MKRLSFLDALFLYMETPETPMHVASVTIFKPTSPQDDLFARFREHTAARLDLLPSYRRRLEPTPLGIDHPAWVIEDKLDLDYHIRHEALPKPGGMNELRALIAQMHAVPLDRQPFDEMVLPQRAGEARRFLLASPCTVSTVSSNQLAKSCLTLQQFAAPGSVIRHAGANSYSPLRLRESSALPARVQSPADREPALLEWDDVWSVL